MGKQKKNFDVCRISLLEIKQEKNCFYRISICNKMKEKKKEKKKLNVTFNCLRYVTINKIRQRN